ncbi:unnamed protein product [marine sediment metagenome]|uniref:Uncharacterized protein n=1 Tax=marine sediment metagenome TaxID=412755 RepID=X1M2N3_9ZZZZ
MKLESLILLGYAIPVVSFVGMANWIKHLSGKVGLNIVAGKY